MDLSTALTETGTSDFTGFDPVLNNHFIPQKYIVSLEESDEQRTDPEYEETITSSYREYAAELLALHPANTTAAAMNAYNAILRAG
ncbi:hypothetical protein N7527_001960 [Penicillium freii]|nr:hypothetical protein N7527_001960 [Penicillium freii]